MSVESEADEQKLAELAAIIQGVKDRVRSRYQHAGGAISEGGHAAIHVPLADLLPVLHARDAAQARVAAIGSVNPRSGGLANKIIQAVKRYIARALGWFVRDQVTFNREAVSAVEAILEALNEQNRAIASLAAQSNEQFTYSRNHTVAELSKSFDTRIHDLSIQVELRHREGLAELQSRVGELVHSLDLRSMELSGKIEIRASELANRSDLHARELSDQIEARAREIHAETDPLVLRLESSRTALSDQIEARARDLSLQIDSRVYELKAEAQELKDIRKHWIEWRAGWEHKLATNEVYFLRTAAELQGAFQHRVNQLETTFDGKVKMQHADYLGALDRANLDIQKRLWSDLEKIRADYDRLIHTELRLIRLRGTSAIPIPTPVAAPALVQQPAASQALGFDYSRFAERFRGDEDYVRRNQEFYRRFFEGRENVLDIGCGRGEFLGVMRDAGVRAKGIDLGSESVEQCRARGLEAEVADLFAYLAAQPDEEFDGILSAQVVEHLDPNRLPEMIRLCTAKLRRGGILAIETPNPECLAIFATHFYLDPTHTRPVPHPLLSFYMEEAGLGGLELYKLSPAVESMPELAELPAEFRKRFFGGLDYSIVARKL